MNWLNRYFLEKSKASVIALSRESRDFYQGILKNPCYYLKTGIDLCKFHPVDEKRKHFLREKYGFSKDRKLILHVGHLKRARNILSICEIDPKYQICLVVSSSTEKEADVRAALKEYKNIRLIEEYIPEIQEYYQMADVYFFPVWQTENCIDIPLSVLEAGACNLPIVTTDYGELKEFAGKEGFYFLSSFEKEHLDQRISEACQSRPGEAQLQEIRAYDWERSIQVLMEILTQKKGG